MLVMVAVHGWQNSLEDVVGVGRVEGEATTAGTAGEAASAEATSGSARASSALQTLLAELVVDCTLVLVAEDLVRFTEL